MRSRLMCSAALGAVLLPFPVLAQKRVPVMRPPALRTMPSDSLVASVPVHGVVPPVRSTPQARPFRSLAASTYVLSRLDDNVNRDSIAVASVGMITGLTARFESGPTRPWLALEYDVALHRYTATSRFDRVSQRGRVTLSSRLRKWWTMDLVTEGSLKGSSEDRDVSDQLTLQPRSEFRLGEARRVRVVGTQRWRRYPSDTLQDATNRYAAIEFRHRMPDGAAFEAEARVESNDAMSPRFDYRRTTWATGYSTPLGGHVLLEVEMQYRYQAYAGRTVEIDDIDYLRRDHRLEPAASLQIRMGAADLEVAVEPEWRRSNDPGKSFTQRLLVFGVRRRW